MMAITLFIVLLFLGASHLAARKAPLDVRWGTFLFISSAPLLLSCVLMNLISLTLFGSLCLSLYFWPSVRGRLRFFWPLSAASLLVTTGVALFLLISYDRTLDRVRERFPLESMEERVPPPVPSGLDEKSMDARLSRFEKEIANDLKRHSFRESRLAQLHDETIHRFSTAPGFGAGRMVPGPTGLHRDPENWPPPSQSPIRPEFEEVVPLSAVHEEELSQLHLDSSVEFTNTLGFGLIRNRQEVAGFEPHRFGSPRQRSSAWEVQRIDLISLLLHKQPVAYVSDNFPAMDQLRKASTRPLDPFEESSLASIRAGSELIAGSTTKDIRMIGAIRNAKQCVECHAGKRGDLLGAFSYTLRKSEAKDGR